MAVPKTVLITGCSTGIGLETALLLAKNEERKFKVYATMKDLSKKEKLEKEAGCILNSTLFIRKLDVTSDEQIDSVVEGIINEESKIDVLVNNAGIGMFGPLEMQSMEKIREMFAVNVYGPINLAKKLMKFWKEDRFGHLIMMSSVGGAVGIPFNSTYCASKFAIEGFSEAIAMEYKNIGLKVSIIEPGPVISNFVEKTIANSQNIAENKDQLTKEMVDIFMDKGRSRYATMGQTPSEIAAYILEAIESPQPQLRYCTNKLYSTAIDQKLNDPPHRNPLQKLINSP